MSPRILPPSSRTRAIGRQAPATAALPARARSPPRAARGGQQGPAQFAPVGGLQEVRVEAGLAGSPQVLVRADRRHGDQQAAARAFGAGVYDDNR
jgi:hypothetical protein